LVDKKKKKREREEKEEREERVGSGMPLRSSSTTISPPAVFSRS
jgi:hypothetical protein